MKKNKVVMRTCGGEKQNDVKKISQLSHEHSLLTVGCFVLLFSSFLLISGIIFAQEAAPSGTGLQSSMVSATVVNPYYKVRTKNFFEKMDPYEKLLFESSLGLTFALTIALVLHYQHRDRRERKPAFA